MSIVNGWPSGDSLGIFPGCWRTIWVAGYTYLSLMGLAVLLDRVCCFERASLHVCVPGTAKIYLFEDILWGCCFVTFSVSSPCVLSQPSDCTQGVFAVPVGLDCGTAVWRFRSWVPDWLARVRGMLPEHARRGGLPRSPLRGSLVLIWTGLISTSHFQLGISRGSISRAIFSSDHSLIEIAGVRRVWRDVRWNTF